MTGKSKRYIHLIGEQQLLLVILPGTQVLVLWRLVGWCELRQCADWLCAVRLAKVGDGVAVVEPRGQVLGEDDAVASRAELVVGPARKTVANVDDHLVEVLGRDGEVSARVVLGLNLQAASVVLEEQGDCAEVGVFRDALGAFADLGGLAARVVVQAQLRRVVVAEVEEEVGLEVQADGKGAEDVLVDAVAALVEGFHGLTEAGDVGLVGPAVGVEVVLDRADIKRFLGETVSIRQIVDRKGGVP